MFAHYFFASLQTPLPSIQDPYATAGTKTVKNRPATRKIPCSKNPTAWPSGCPVFGNGSSACFRILISKTSSPVETTFSRACKSLLGGEIYWGRDEENISGLYLWAIGAVSMDIGVAGPISKWSGNWLTYVTLESRCWARNLAVGGSENRYPARKVVLMTGVNH